MQRQKNRPASSQTSPSAAKKSHAAQSTDTDAPRQTKFTMGADPRAIKEIFCNDMYGSVDMALRELLQNSVDAVLERQQQERELAGRIDITCNIAARTIHCAENGIGMDDNDLRSRMGTIGVSGKQDKEYLIGQFGIGKLAQFKISDRIAIHTRKAGSKKGFLLTIDSDMNCTLEAATVPSCGTTVTLHLSGEFDHLVCDDYIENVIRTYCNLAPVPIYLNGRGPINAVTYPWEKGEMFDEESGREFIRSIHGENPLAIFPVQIDGDYRARGILYITVGRMPGVAGAAEVDLYVKRMLVRGADRTLLPPWAACVKGIIDSPDLKVTAARDGIMVEDDATLYLRRRLGKVVVEGLKDLARDKPERFSRIAEYHHYHLKGMACMHTEFFDQIATLLPLNTSSGEITLGACIERAAQSGGRGEMPLLRYHADSSPFTQFKRLAEARSWLVVDAGSGFDADLLRLYAERNPKKVKLVRLDSLEQADIFERLDPSAEKRFMRLENEIVTRMRDKGVENLAVRTRSFQPEDVPALVHRDRRDESIDTLRSALSHPAISDIAREIAGDLLTDRKPSLLTLTLNARNPLVAELANIDRYIRIEEQCTGWAEKILDPLLGGIFSTALMASGVPTSGSDVDLFRSQFTRAFAGALFLLEEMAVCRKENSEIRNMMSNGWESHNNASTGFYNC